jgi:hypothetical protein
MKSFIGWLSIQLVGSQFGFIFGIGLILSVKRFLKIIFLVKEKGIFVVREGSLPDHFFVLFGFEGIWE